VTEPLDLTRAARGLLAGGSDVGTTAAIHLARQALEASLDRLWTREGADAARAPMRSQLIALPHYLDPDLARRVAWVWTSLSEAGHEREIARRPTEAGLAAWLAVVEDLARAVA
jgi:hypothetical protein